MLEEENFRDCPDEYSWGEHGHGAEGGGGGHLKWPSIVIKTTSLDGDCGGGVIAVR